MRKFFSEFKKFITRGNVLDLAVGVIIGSAFSAIVTALTNKILMPLFLFYLLYRFQQVINRNLWIVENGFRIIKMFYFHSGMKGLLLFLRSLVAALCRDDNAGVFTYLSFRYVVRRVVEGFARKNLLLCVCCRCFTLFQHDRFAAV